MDPGIAMKPERNSDPFPLCPKLAKLENKMFLAYRLSNLYLITLGHFHISPQLYPITGPIT